MSYLPNSENDGPNVDEFKAPLNEEDAMRESIAVMQQRIAELEQEKANQPLDDCGLDETPVDSPPGPSQQEFDEMRRRVEEMEREKAGGEAAPAEDNAPSGSTQQEYVELQKRLEALQSDAGPDASEPSPEEARQAFLCMQERLAELEGVQKTIDDDEEVNERDFFVEDNGRVEMMDEIQELKRVIALMQADPRNSSMMSSMGPAYPTSAYPTSAYTTASMVQSSTPMYPSSSPLYTPIIQGRSGITPSTYTYSSSSSPLNNRRYVTNYAPTYGSRTTHYASSGVPSSSYYSSGYSRPTSTYTTSPVYTTSTPVYSSRPVTTSTYSSQSYTSGGMTTTTTNKNGKVHTTTKKQGGIGGLKNKLHL
eukprot:GHVH01004308.1.p1 GENE.GHVH01004308.1~~GHVH01004308.1.p1  ORF type:complete len:365 (+),score=68.59 GHVH01004308.1:130-1224(+)